MKNSTARKLQQIPAGYLLMGVDPHKKKHVAVAMTQDAIVHAKLRFTNSKEGFEEMLERARAEMVRTGSRGVTFAIETASHYWRNLAYFLDEQGIPFRLINPFTLKRRREGEDVNRRKNDFRDAEMAAELLRTGKFIETRLPRGIYAELRATYYAYRRLVKDRARFTNLLKGLLDGLFPEFTGVFRNPRGKTALTVLSLCPVPRIIASMTLEDFVDSIRKEFHGRAPKVQKLHALYSASKTSVGIDAGAESISFELSLLTQRIRLNEEQIERTEAILVSLVDSITDSRYLLSIRGLSYISVAGIMAELGPLSLYRDAGQLIKMAGSNPTESESAGKQASHTPMSKKGRSGLRWCTWVAAVSLLRHNPDFASWAKDRMERPAHAHPLEKREVIGALANRLLRLAYALVKKQTMYRVPQMAEIAI